MKNYLRVTPVLVLVSAVILIAATVMRDYAVIDNYAACAVLFVFGFIGCMYAVPALKQQAKAMAIVKPIADVELMEKYLKFMEKKKAQR